MPKGIKTGGRTKGTPNKATKELRERFSDLLESNFESIQTDLESLEPKERIKTLLEISKFVIPTLKAVDNTIDLDNVQNEKRPNIIFLGNGIKPN
ncbi:MAG: hypothetical protein RL264_2488 [Bacteroidota bacterium]|jgi:DNA phosphorothioation-dependent restriction protein DptG